MTRNDYDIEMCAHENTNEFDWDLYQNLCNIANEWEYEENITDEWRGEER